MHNFFITGLPRARTNTYCYHEPSRNFKTSLEIYAELSSRKEEFVGISDCLLPFYYEAIAEMSKAQRLVIIERDFIDSFNSTIAWSGMNLDQDKLFMHFEMLKHKIEMIKGQFEYINISYEDLEKPEKIEELWYYCVPGIEFDRQRFEMLNYLKVEPHPTKYYITMDSTNVKSIMGVL
jgi:hypothetical protein